MTTANMNTLKHFSQVSLQTMEPRYRAAFINSLSGFKPANLIATANTEGQSNLAIMTSVVHLGASPALQGLIIRPDASKRDTLSNILSTGYFSINHVHQGMLPAAHQTSARYPQTVSEFAETGLTEQWLDGVPAPLVAESHIKLLMQLREHQVLNINQTHFIIAEIKQVFLPADCLTSSGYVDIESAGSIAASGLDSYHETERLMRLAYAKPDVAPTRID